MDADPAGLSQNQKPSERGNEVASWSPCHKRIETPADSDFLWFDEIFLIDPAATQKDQEQACPHNQLYGFVFGSRTSKKSEDNGQREITEEGGRQKFEISHLRRPADQAYYRRVSQWKKTDVEHPKKTVVTVAVIPDFEPFGYPALNEVPEQPSADEKIDGGASDGDALGNPDSQMRTIHGTHDCTDPDSRQAETIGANQNGQEHQRTRPIILANICPPF
ncbi:MAG: hypothetical protein L6301_10250 [Desulfobacteraceae bacterium]|nr:hypothetical protein [Desulfobacteraceae bacterium]